MNKVNSDLSNLVQHFINRKIFMCNTPNTMFRHKYQSTKINQNPYPKIPENVYRFNSHLKKISNYSAL